MCRIAIIGRLKGIKDKTGWKSVDEIQNYDDDSY